MALKTTRWDAADFLTSERRIALFLQAAFDDGDPAVISAALGEVARARGMTDLARETGIRRESLYTALSREGNPELKTLVKVLRAFGLSVAVQPVGPRSRLSRRRSASRNASTTKRATAGRARQVPAG